MVASTRGFTEIAKALMGARANPDLQDKQGDTALIRASTYGNNEIAKALIGAGANLNLQSKLGYTALIEASDKGNIEMAKVLIEAGANLDLKDNGGKTAHSYSMASEMSGGNTEIVAALEEAGCMESKSGCTIA